MKSNIKIFEKLRMEILITEGTKSRNHQGKHRIWLQISF